MSTMEQLLDPSSEQIRYVQCGLCSTILLVNVPYSNLSMVVSVRCGNCTGLLSVNMAKPSFIPFDLLTSLSNDLPKEPFEDFNLQKQYCAFDSQLNNTSDLVTSYHNIQNHEDDDVVIIPPTPVVNKPPEKKQRAPSAYNQFIKEEIRRLKAENPAMAHKEAFKTAAKNWAHLPPVNGEGDHNNHMRKKNVSYAVES